MGGVAPPGRVRRTEEEGVRPADLLAGPLGEARADRDRRLPGRGDLAKVRPQHLTLEVLRAVPVRLVHLDRQQGLVGTRQAPVASCSTNIQRALDAMWSMNGLRWV